MLEMDDESPTLQPTKRRRSSLLSRKSVGPSVVSHTGEVALKQYITETRQECDDWKDLAVERRKQAKIAEEAYKQTAADPPTITFDTVKEDLTSEDLDFITKQPDYEKLSNNIDRLLEDYAILKTSFENVNSLVSSNMSLTSARVTAIAKTICHFNDTAPIKQVNEA